MLTLLLVIGVTRARVTGIMGKPVSIRQWREK